MDKKKHDKVLVVCSSVFQLYVAIIIKKTFLRDEKVDLVLTDATLSFSIFYKNKRLAELFHSVRFAEICKKEKALNRIERSKYGKMFFEMFPRRYVKKVWGIDVKKYQQCFFSSYINQNVMLQYAIKKNGKNTKVHMFEDGISTYIIKNEQYLRTPRVLRKLFNIYSIEEILNDVYVFEPNLVCLDQYKTLIKIPKPQEIDGIKETLDELFTQSNYTIKEKFIFFEESFNNDGYKTNDSELINMLWELCDGKDFILKHHPRNSVDRFKTILPTIEAPIFWENYILNNPIDDKILVTVSSNTVFVPYILCEVKPTVVLLYKIFTGTSPVLGCVNFDLYIEKYIKKYEEYTKAKLYIPQTLEEFKEIINNLKRKRMQNESSCCCAHEIK